MSLFNSKNAQSLETGGNALYARIRQEVTMSFISGLRTIVVATDLHGQAASGSSIERSSSLAFEAALEYARKLATAYGARIVLAHGLDPIDYAAVDAIPARVLKDLNESARKVLEKLGADLMQEGIHSHSEIRQGAVAEMLADVAKQYEAGLIVIGTEGREGAGPVVVGAVAERLVRIAPCPVLTVAADWNAGPHRPTPGGPVLLAIEQNDAASEAAAIACSLAEKFLRPLILVHGRTAVESASNSNPKVIRVEDYGIHPRRGVLIQEIVKDGNPVDAVTDAIEQHHPCILVVGVKRTSDTPGPHGTAFALMARSRVPVICVPPAWVAGGRDRESALAIEA
jgi:nucleotide-binding universal stress UspA family protein